MVGYIATCIGNLTAAGNNDYFVLDIINGNQIANQFTGQSVYNNIVACNALLLAAYGNRYIAIRKPLISLYNASLPLDVLVDFNNDCVPNSLHAVLKSGTSSAITTTSTQSFTLTYAVGTPAANDIIGIETARGFY